MSANKLLHGSAKKMHPVSNTLCFKMRIISNLVVAKKGKSSLI